MTKEELLDYGREVAKRAIEETHAEIAEHGLGELDCVDHATEIAKRVFREMDLESAIARVAR